MRQDAMKPGVTTNHYGARQQLKEDGETERRVTGPARLGSPRSLSSSSSSSGWSGRQGSTI